MGQIQRRRCGSDRADPTGAKTVYPGALRFTDRSCRTAAPIQDRDSNPAPGPDRFSQSLGGTWFRNRIGCRGIAPAEANFVELPSDGDFIAKTWNNRKFGYREVEALDQGEVDAIYIKSTQVQTLLDTGKYKVIFAINANPRQLAPINNEYPNALTVSRHLAEDFPEVVVAYVKQLLLAAEWAKTHRAEVLELFAAQTFGTPGQMAASHSFDFHKRLTPLQAASRHARRGDNLASTQFPQSFDAGLVGKRLTGFGRPKTFPL